MFKKLTVNTIERQAILMMRRVRKKIFDTSFIFYLFAMVMLLYVGVMFVGRRGYGWKELSLWEYVRSSSNFIPFKTISTYITAIFDGSLNLSIPLKNLLGNLVMFMPTGIYLPYYLKKVRKLRRFMLSMTVILFAIEITQVVARRGSFDIDDFILNMIGAFIGYKLWKTKFVQKLLR